MAELQIFAKWIDFLKWLLQTTDKFPKKVRFTITTRVDNLALDILENIILCKYDCSARPAGLKRLNINIEKLRVLLRISHDFKYISTQQYQYASIQINEVGKMVWGWLNEGQSS